MRSLPFLVGTLSLMMAGCGAARAQGFHSGRAVADGDLDKVRGGFVLPNGLDVRLGVTVDTLVDGRLALSTLLTVDDVAQLSVYSNPGAGPGSESDPLVVRSTAGGPLVRVTQGALAPSAQGAQPLAVVAGGVPVQTAFGAVTLAQSDTQATVSLVGEGIEVRHMIGATTGALIANSVGERVIDTMVTVDVDVRNSAIPTGAMVLRLEGVLADAAALRALR